MSDRVKQILDTYNVVWTSPSKNSGESMPCGGGDIGLNVWVESGDLLIYLAKSGTFDELNRMPKLGRVRVTLEPNPFLDYESFRQELKLWDGHLEILAKKDGLEAKVGIWVSVFQPVVHIEVETSGRTKVCASYENWRLAERDFGKSELHAARSWAGAPRVGRAMPDEVRFTTSDVRFVHRNAGHSAFDLCVEQQKLDRVSLDDPLKNRAFGGLLSGGSLMQPDGVSEGVYASTPFRAWRLRSERSDTRHSLAVLLISHDEATGNFDDAIDEAVRSLNDHSTARKRTVRWWHDFWNRSHIFVDADNSASANPLPQPLPQGEGSQKSPQWTIARNYHLFRYQLACNAFGEWPTKFNGGLFTFDPEFVVEKKKLDPDFRLWGGGTFTAQNQRLVYWPMLKSGDIDLMRPAFNFYLRNLQNAEARAKHYWNIDGACFAEQIESFGLPVGFEYGWKRPADFEPGIEHNHWVDFQWDTVFEFCLMMLDAREYGGFDLSPYLPLIESCLRFYDAFYRDRGKRLTGHELDRDGKLRLFPATACETYKNATNPTSTLSGLRTVLTRVIGLPDSLLSAGRRERWRAMLATIPDFAYREMNGHKTIAPAWSWTHKQNCELPQLYPVFPYDLFGIGRPHLDVAINTWKHGTDDPDQKQIVSWHQDAIFCARLGLTDEAAALTIEKLKDAPRRFPSFWGPGHDWTPDHNWGGSGMIGLQEMLLQCVDEKIYLLPAWPRGWDVEFKLHAPGQTTVECVLRDGAIRSLSVTPRERARDVILPA